MRMYYHIVSTLFLIQCCNGVPGNVFSIFDSTSNHDSSDKSSKCQTKRVTCFNADKFSNLDGSCNNIDNPTWGSSGTILQRLLPPEYSDNKGAPRTHGKNGELLSTREISNILNSKNSKNILSTGVSHMHPLWGQLLAHDIIHTPLVKVDCECANPLPDCINIKIPTEDVQSVNFNRKCMELARSKAATGIDGCTFQQREQVTTMSSFIDGTFMYGKSDEEARELRDFSSASGQLKTVPNPASNEHANLPNQDQMKHTNIGESMDCPAKVHKPADVPCFVAGDVRANENPGLASIQTIMTRYHNHVAKELKSVNPYWSSDRIFNVARQILSALIQLITYREYLPLLLGPKWMKRFELQLNDDGYWNGYDSKYNPAIANAFTTAAFRYGHSQVAATLSRPGSFFNRYTVPAVPSKGTFFSSEPLLDKNGGGSGAIMRGFMTDNAEKTDTSAVDALQNHLLAHIGKGFGNDLFAINAQRGRDHGLPGYVKYRELCGLRPVTSFSDLSDVIPIEKIQLLSKAYKSVHDIDLYYGGLAENLVDGGEVGPTFACILAYGFRALKKGDRYWHEYKYSPTPFTVEQLSSLRKITLASILCISGEDMEYVVENAMLMKNGKRGKFVHCGNVNSLDVSVWKEYSNNFYSNSRDFDQTQWTPWFVTPYRYDEENSVSVQKMKENFRKERAKEMCEDVHQWETRKNTRGIYLQIRFLCSVGSTSATDFPYQLSQENYWTPWIPPGIVGYYEGQAFVASDFDCDNVVSIQVRSGTRFAMETGDVFDVKSADSFTCLDEHQPSGRCQRYQARALCAKTSKTFKRKEDNQIYSADSNSVVHAFSPQPENTYSFEETSIVDDIKEIARGYCDTYSICCSNPNAYASYGVPKDILSYTKYLCENYNVCCDSHL